MFNPLISLCSALICSFISSNELSPSSLSIINNNAWHAWQFFLSWDSFLCKISRCFIIIRAAAIRSMSISSSKSAQISQLNMRPSYIAIMCHMIVIWCYWSNNKDIAFVPCSQKALFGQFSWYWGNATDKPSLSREFFIYYHTFLLSISYRHS